MVTVPASGALLANRFEIERIAGTGGMGTVYRAQDRFSGGVVALKLLHPSGGGSNDSDRFARESQILSELRHPGIVSYVAHGALLDGQRYLAMEWLEGHDLAHQLTQGPLPIRVAAAMMSEVAAALAAAHQRGIIHRDLKPSNIFLPHGSPTGIKLLDFGIARRLATAQAITRTGIIIGTPDYMAPEQARGDRDVGPAADIFSLGCVLYECLTGRPPFVGEHVASVLVRILMEAPPPVSERRTDVPPSLEALLGQMLTKDAKARPSSAAQLAEELSAIARDLPSGISGAVTVEVLPKPSSDPALKGQEQSLCCVVIATPPGTVPDALESGPTPRAEGQGAAARPTGLQDALAALGGKTEWLFDGSLVVTVASRGSATDQAMQAARIALLIKERWAGAEVALATGCGAIRGNIPVGEAVDRAAKLLRVESAENAPFAQQIGVWLDELSAGLLARRFALTRRHGRVLLSGEELSADETQPLLGKPTPCVGRDQELGILDMVLSSCIEESEANAVLITAEPGMGKSRLRHEFLRRLAGRDVEVTVLLGVGDMLSAGSPFAMLRAALRRLSGIHGAEPLSLQREAFAERSARHCGEPERKQITEFLGELCGIPFPDDDSPLLRAARNDPKVMSDQIAEAFIRFLRAECQHAPVLIVLEDLHWGDALTVKLCATALRELSACPLMVLGLARPTVRELFPKLWAGCKLREVELNQLSRRASERLIQQVLGRVVSPEITARIIDQAAGNALFLEELIRAQAAGKGNALPETVLAMLQARIGSLESPARRALRAASVYGQIFWRGSVRAILSPERETHDLDEALCQLLEHEFIDLKRDSQIADEPEYHFRHALIREAAYSLLTEEERRLGHRLAGQYLESHGQVDALTLAEHFQKGGLNDKAAEHYLRASNQSCDRNDLDGALSRAARGLECLPQGETLGNLLALQALAHCWCSQMTAGYQKSRLALPLVRPGSRWACIVLFHGTWAALVIGDDAVFADMATRLSQFVPEADALRDYLLWTPLAASLLTSYGQRALAHEMLSRVEELGRQLPVLDLDLRASRALGLSDYVRAFESQPWRQLQLSQEAVQAFEQIGDRRNLVTALNRLGQAQSELGDAQLGEQTLRTAVALAQRIRVPFAVLQSELHLAAHLCLSLSKTSQPEQLAEAQRIAESVLATEGISAGYRGWVGGILARIAMHRREFAHASEQARQALLLCARLPLRRLWVMSLLIRCMLARGLSLEARELAEEGLGAMRKLGGAGYIEVDMRLAAAEAAAAVGDLEAARAEGDEAVKQLELRAALIPDLDWKTRYLENIPENTRLRELVKTWRST